MREETNYPKKKTDRRRTLCTYYSLQTLKLLEPVSSRFYSEATCEDIKLVQDQIRIYGVYV